MQEGMLARWAVMGDNVNATVATFREFGSRPRRRRDLSKSLIITLYFNKLNVNFPVLLNPIV